MQSTCATAQRREINQYKAARMAAGMTQTKASLALFISMRALQYYESGQNEPPQDVRKRMAMLYRAPHLALEQRSPAALMGWLMKEKKDLDERMCDLLDIAYDVLMLAMRHGIDPKRRPADETDQDAR